jgi:membrane protein
LKPRRIGALLVEAFNDWSTHGATRLGAALAYYTLFSIAPVLIVVTGVVGVFMGRAAARGEVAPWLERLLSPEGAKAAEVMLSQAATPTGGVLSTLVGLLTLFLGTSALASELRQSLNVVWGVQSATSQDVSVLKALRAMVSDRLYAFVIVVAAGLLIIASVVVNTAVAAAGSWLHGWLPLPESALYAMDFAIAFLLTTTMFTLVYKTLPDAHVAWGDAWVGAFVTAFLFTLGGMVLSIFLGKAGGGSVYGTAASVLALLLWVYYSAQVFFFGAELTRIFATRYGGGIVPRHHSLRSLLRQQPSGQSAH